MADTTSPNPEHVLRIAEELSLNVHQIAATAQLFAEGATVPFIARYRKEATGELDEVQVMAIRDRLEQMKQIDERRATILASLKDRNLLTPELEKSINAAETLTKLEDIYLPFRPKKRTRATIAKEKGLEPLSELLWAQDPSTDVASAAAALIGHEYILDDGRRPPEKSRLPTMRWLVLETSSPSGSATTLKRATNCAPFTIHKPSFRRRS